MVVDDSAVEVADFEEVEALLSALAVVHLAEKCNGKDRSHRRLRHTLEHYAQEVALVALAAHP